MGVHLVSSFRLELIRALPAVIFNAVGRLLPYGYSAEDGDMGWFSLWKYY